MTIKDFFSFRQNRFFWANILAMAVVVVGLLFGVLKGLDIYTRHGEAVIVPDVKGMGVEEAEKMFRNRGLVCIVSDSSYVKTLPAGCILEYNPAAGQKVKEGRSGGQQFAAAGGSAYFGFGLQAGRDTVYSG